MAHDDGRDNLEGSRGGSRLVVREEALRFVAAVICRQGVGSFRFGDAWRVMPMQWWSGTSF